jgi:hypothetical protein
MSEEVSSETAQPKGLTRKGFLGLAGKAAVAGAVTGVLGGRVFAETSKKYQEAIVNAPIIHETKETPEAVYEIFGETHSKAPSLDQIQAVNPDAHFVELITNQKYETFQRNSFSQIINSPLDQGRKKLVAPDLLQYLDGRILAIEGTSYPEEVFNRSDAIAVTKSIAALALGGVALYETTNAATSREISRRQFLRFGLGAAAGVAAVAFSGRLVDALASLSRSSGQKGVITDLDTTFKSIDYTDARICFRNIMFALKQKNIVDNIEKPDGQKPTVSSQIGLRHLGFENFLELDKEDLIEMVKLYPKDMVNQIVDHNGGLVNFCKTRYGNSIEDFTSDTAEAKYFFDQGMFDGLKDHLGRED